MSRLSKKKSGDISPDLTSFSDIANLLIIFFILTTTLARPFGRRMDMPSSSKPPEEQKQQAVQPTVNIMADRLMFSEGDKSEREVTMNELRSLLWKKNFPAKAEKDRAVILETAPEVTYERYYQVATAIAAAGGVIAILSD